MNSVIKEILFIGIEIRKGSYKTERKIRKGELRSRQGKLFKSLFDFYPAIYCIYDLTDLEALNCCKTAKRPQT